MRWHMATLPEELLGRNVGGLNVELMDQIKAMAGDEMISGEGGGRDFGNDIGLCQT